HHSNKARSHSSLLVEALLDAVTSLVGMYFAKLLFSSFTNFLSPLAPRARLVSPTPIVAKSQLYQRQGSLHILYQKAYFRRRGRVVPIRQLLRGLASCKALRAPLYAASIMS